VLSVPRVDLARADELPLIAAARAAEGWQPNAWLLELLHAWEDARLFVIRDDASRDAAEANAPFLAATSAVAYGALGFIGCVVVRPDARGRGLGRRVMEAAIDWMAARGTRRVELDATAPGRPLYERLGFVGSVHSWTLWAPLATIDRAAAAAMGAGYACAALGPGGVTAVADLDRRALGGVRSGLLARTLALPDSRAYLARDAGGAAAGYVVVRPLHGGARGLHLGPWVAREPGAAAALLAHALRAAAGEPPGGAAGHLHATIPGTAGAALDLCAALGLTLIQDDLRMRLDLPGETAEPASPAEAEAAWAYAMLSQMVG
jgi:GNAT superfamily N-acetyltransferase